MLLAKILLLHFVDVVVVVHYFGIQVKPFRPHHRFVLADLRVLCFIFDVEKIRGKKSCYRKVIISKRFIINRSPDTAETVCPTVSIFNDTVFVFTCFSRTWSCVMMFATCCQAFSQRTLNGKVAARLGLQMSVVHLHLNNPHKLNLACKLLYLLLRRKKGAKRQFNCFYRVRKISHLLPLALRSLGINQHLRLASAHRHLYKMRQ